MDTITNEIFRALGYLLIAGVAWYAWKLADDNARGGRLKEVLWKGLLWCGALALFASISLGNATCEVEGDPLYGGCEQYADDGYEPTTEQRTARFVYILALLYIPVAIGAFTGDKKS